MLAISSAAGTNLESEGAIQNKAMASSVAHKRGRQPGTCWMLQHQTLRKSWTET